jgi:hypothetical protein
MAFKVNPFDIYRHLLLGRLDLNFLGYSRLLIIIILFIGIALVLTIPELALLAEFTRHSISQGSIYSFEIVGLVASALTMLVLPVLCVIYPLQPLKKEAIMSVNIFHLFFQNFLAKNFTGISNIFPNF